MKESILRDFLEGTAPVEELEADTTGAFEQQSRDARRLIVETMADQFAVGTDHVVKLCNAVLDGNLNPSNLEVIGFALIASDQFEWNTDTDDGERVGEVLFDWSAPEINHDLTVENVRCWKRYLETGKPAFEKRHG